MPGAGATSKYVSAVISITECFGKHGGTQGVEDLSARLPGWCRARDSAPRVTVPRVGRRGAKTRKGALTGRQPGAGGGLAALLVDISHTIPFEPTVGCPTPDFESGALDHSATSPERTLHGQNCGGRRRERRTHFRKRKPKVLGLFFTLGSNG